MVATFLALSMLRQNPAPPEVVLPPEWNVHYWSKEGFGTGEIDGPHGEVLIFPGYNATGALAATIRETAPGSLQVRTILGGWRVDIAVRKDGYLAVSYPPAPEKKGRCFDYWMHPRSAREGAFALAIALTRPQILGTREPNAEEVAMFSNIPPGTKYPFDHMFVDWPFTYAGWSSDKVEFKNKEGLTVSRQSGAPAKVKWQDQMTILGRDLVWGEDVSGHGWAMVKDGQSVFVSSAANNQGVALTLVLALTAKP